MKKFEFDNLQEAWEGINEFLYIKEKQIIKKWGGKYGPEIICYDIFMVIKKPWVDPNFDFGRMFGYRIQKWSSLLNNYLDRNYLDLLRDEILIREKRKAKSYNYVLHFKNTHISGKDCLISLVISRRVISDRPTLLFHVRISEVTKRLLLDFLLVQRIAEFIFGKNPDVEIRFFSPACYITFENFSMYDIHRPIKKLIPKDKELGVFQKRMLKVLNNFKTIKDPYSIKYKVNRRAALQLQTDEEGMPLSGKVGLYAKDLLITKDTIIYPKDCITEQQRRKYRKNQKS